MKKMHIVCPECGGDIVLGMDKIEHQLDDAKADYQILQTKLSELRAQGRKRSPEYKRLLNLQQEQAQKLASLKTYRKNANMLKDKQLYETVCKKLKSLMGEKAYIEYMNDLDDDFMYDNKTLSHQSYSNYNGA